MTASSRGSVETLIHQWLAERLRSGQRLDPADADNGTASELCTQALVEIDTLCTHPEIAPADQEHARIARGLVERVQSMVRTRSAELLRMRILYRSWRDGDEPEGAPSARRTLEALGDILEGRDHG